MKIKKLHYLELKNYKSKVEKEGVDLKNNGTIYYGAEIDGKLAGFVGVKIMSPKSTRYKSDYVFEEFRSRGVYDNLFQARDKIVGVSDVGQEITAFCTKFSIGTYLRYGFEIQSQNKNGVYFVKRSKGKVIKSGVGKKEEKAMPGHKKQ